MALRKVTFNDSPVRAADHGALFAGIIADGIINGCNISVSNGVASIGAGYFVVAGRLIENNADLTINLTNQGGNIVQVVLALDLSDDDATLTSMIDVRGKSDINQLDPLTKTNINDGVHTDYEFEIAVFNVSNNEVIRQMPVASRPINVLESIPSSWTGYSDGIYLIKSNE